MKNMTLEAIAKACDGELIKRGTDYTDEVTCVVIDSRKIEQGGVFVATPGERVDGHSFIGQVLEQGAAAVICEKVPADLDGIFIKVSDSFEALKRVASYYRQTLAIPVIGITGSVGKTSTKECIAGLLSTKYDVLYTEGNFNNEIGLPLTVLRIREHHEVAVVEMGINHFGEMHNLSQIARPNIAVMTNIGQCHLEYLGSRQGILKAKSEIFDYMEDGSAVVVNGDDDMLQTIDEACGRRPITFGLSTMNRIYATDIVNRGIRGSQAVFHMDEGDPYEVTIPLPGEHMVYNALAAATVGMLLGMTTQEIAEGMRKVKTIGGRSNVIETGKYTLIDDCYNANPVSVKAALSLLATEPGRKVAILGDMYELGEDEMALHKEVGADAVEKGIDVLICIGEMSEAMAKQAKVVATEGGRSCEILYFNDKEGFLSRQGELLRDGDTILIKASHGMRFELLVKELNK